MPVYGCITADVHSMECIRISLACCREGSPQIVPLESALSAMCEACQYRQSSPGVLSTLAVSPPAFVHWV